MPFTRLAKDLDTRTGQALALHDVLDFAGDLDRVTRVDRTDKGDVYFTALVESPAAMLVEHLGDKSERHQPVRDGSAERAGLGELRIDMDGVEIAASLGIGVDHGLRHMPDQHRQDLARQAASGQISRIRGRASASSAAPKST